MLLPGIKFQAVSEEHEITAFFFLIFGCLNDCCLKNIDDTVPSIVITTGIIYHVALCSFVSLFFSKEPLHFCPRCAFILCSDLIDMLSHGIVFKATS